MRSLSQQTEKKRKKNVWIKMKRILRYFDFFSCSVPLDLYINTRNLILLRHFAVRLSFSLLHSLLLFIHPIRDFPCFLVRAIGFRAYNLPDSLIFFGVCVFVYAIIWVVLLSIFRGSCVFVYSSVHRLDFIFHIDTEPSRKYDINQITHI